MGPFKWYLYLIDLIISLLHFTFASPWSHLSSLLSKFFPNIFLSQYRSIQLAVLTVASCELFAKILEYLSCKYFLVHSTLQSSTKLIETARKRNQIIVLIQQTTKPSNRSLWSRMNEWIKKDPTQSRQSWWLNLNIIDSHCTVVTVISNCKLWYILVNK